IKNSERENRRDAQNAKKEAEKVKKEEQQAKKYWNTMISRGEAYQMVSEALESQNDKFRLLLIQVKTLSKVLIDNGLVTEEGLDELSKPIIKDIYGELPSEDDQQV